MTQPVLETEAAEGDRHYDVFLSYNSVDADAVEQLALRLTGANLTVWFDRWRITAGDDWQDELADGSARSDGCLVFVGPSGIGDWARQELKVALDRSAKRPGYRVVPVLLPGAGIPFDPTVELPPFLRLRSWLDLRAGIGGDEVVRQLVEAVHGVAPGPPATTAEQAVCPYRGLRPFEEADRDLFFGRDGDVAQVLEKLRGSRFLAVLGPSGSGKSSLVKAGLLPALRHGSIAGAERWRVATMRPGPRPLGELAAELTVLGHPHATTSLLDSLSRDDRALALASAAVLAGDDTADGLLWVVDQLEELFTLVRDGSEARFIANLVDAAANPVAPVRVVVTMRADFYAKCAAFPELAQLMAAHQYLVSPLDLEGWRAAIEEPAWRSGLELQSGLVETILDDAVGRPGSLPLVQEALVALWERRRGNVLTLDGYVAAGRVAGAVAKRADTVFTALGPGEQVAAREVLLRLVQLGEGTEDTRRQAREDELFAVSTDGATVPLVIERFVEARLLTTSTGASGVVTVDVAHEALITGWPRLQAWLDENREDLRIRQRLADQATAWIEQDRDEGLLYRGAQLRLAAELQEHGRLHLSGSEFEFLTASRDEAQRVALAAAEAERAQVRQAERDRRRLLGTLALAGGLIVALVLTTVAVQQSREADEQRERARSLSLASQSEVVAPSQLDLGVLLALQARATTPGVEASSSMLDALARGPRPAAYLRPPDGTTIIAPLGLTPDGGRVVAPLSDGRLRVWEPATGKEVATWSAGSHGIVTALSVSRSGGRLALGYQDGTVAVVDAGTGAEVGSAAAHGTAVDSVSFASERTVVSAARDRPIATSFDGATPVSRPLGIDDDVVAMVAVSPDGGRLATVSAERVQLWNLATGAALGAPLLDAASSFPPSPTSSVAWTDDGARVIANVGRLQVFDGLTGTPLSPLMDVTTTSSVLAADTSLVVTANGRDVLAIRGDLASATPTSLLGHTDTVRSVGTSRDGSVIVSAAPDAMIVWHSDLTSPLARTLVPAVDVALTASAVAFLPGGQQVASAAGDAVGRWEVASGSELDPFQSPGGAVTRLASNPATGALVGGTAAGDLVVWNAATGAISARRDRAHPGAVQALAVSDDGRTIASADGAGTIVVSDAASLTPLVHAEHDRGVRALAFSPDDALLASGGDDRTVRLWRLSDAAPVAALPGHTGMVGSLAFGPDGTVLASGGDDATVRLWDVASHESLAVLAGHTDLVLGLRFSPDGRRLVSTGEDATMVLWDVDHRVAIGHPLRTASAAFAKDLDLRADGLVAATIQGSDVVLWDVDDASWLEQACALADRPFTAQEQAQYLGGRQPVEDGCDGEP